MKDGLREARKSRFDPTKLLKVHYSNRSIVYKCRKLAYSTCVYVVMSCHVMSCNIFYNQVLFVFEPGIDTGGLSREFWRLSAKGVNNAYCIGDSKYLIFSKNVPALQVRNCS